GLVVSQASDGGWSWQRTGRHTDWAVTSMNLWALSAAEKEGISVHSQTFSNAVKYLQNRFRSVSATDNDAKAVILHALSTRGKAEFAHANRLHRERNSLSNPALAYTALLFVNLDRNEFASEMLNVLLKKAKKETKPREMLHWEGSGSYAWLNDEVETTAIAALALMRVRPESPEVKKAADYLMRRRGTYGFVPAKAHGPAVTALAAYFGEAQFAEADYRLSVEVNGKKLEVLQSKKTDGMVHLAVPREMLKEGENKVDFQMEGRGEYAYSVTLRGFSKNVKDPHSWNRPYVRHRYYRHARLQYRGRPIGASSSSPVRNIEVGQRVKVHIDIYDYHNNKNYFVVEENLPSGLMLVRDSVSGNFIHHEIHAGKIVMYYRPRNYVRDFSYELVGYSTGRYRVLPTVITDALHPGRMRVGKSTELRVLAPGEKSGDPYKMNRSERYALAKLYFDDGLYDEALPHLRNIFEYNMKHRGSYHEKEVARMLFWIFTSKGFYDAQQIVDTFEVLREKYPRLEIPFDKILVAGRAYRDIGEFERAYLIFKATILASFVKDSNISAVLEDQGQFMGSVRYQKRLWREYPDSAQVVSSYFALAQALYEKAPKADQLAKQARQMADRRGEEGEEPEELDKLSMMEQSVDLLFDFISLYPQNPLADDAAFSISNALLDLKQYETVVELSERFSERYEDSELASGFQYMNALGHFWQHKYKKALAGAKVVARGKSKDRDFARYIVGQIYHALGNASDAIEWYRKVAGQYPDAKQAIEYFERKNVSIDEVNIFRPGEDVRLKLDYRNVKEAFCQVYRVDLMKLYLREKNLANITRINLAGIEPLVEKTIELGDGKDYADRERELDLAIKEEGAYLMICRGDNLFTSG
ncbi:MAG: hypothetical protein KGZ25_15860, partial [Planctomycetes bacterium]|nr:hypothetical protein [Planctomycetota bacterium]